MKEEIEVVCGSGNVFGDFGHASADVEQSKAMLASKIIGVLDDEALSTRQAEAVTGVSHSELARIRGVKLDRFTIDRLITILKRLHRRVELDVTIRTIPEKEQSLALRGLKARQGDLLAAAGAREAEM
jgi:predicted XRE-type DNA-binding protein